MNLSLPASVLCVLAASPAWADCIDAAAHRHKVNPLVLRAIGWHESRLKPNAIGRNRNGSTDIGAFQINSIHLPRLAAIGISADTLRDGCASAEVAAWHYAGLVRQHGNTWKAVGAYHSATPARSAWYANAIAKVLMNWRVLPQAALPYPTEQTLSPTQVSPSPRAVSSSPPAQQHAAYTSSTQVE